MTNIAGLKLITPSSVSGSGVSLSGAKVILTAASSASINDVFDSTYDNYLIVMRGLTSVNQQVRNRFRLSGSDAAGADYDSQRLIVDGSSAAGARNQSENEARCGDFYTTAMNGFHTYVYGPALAQPTVQRTVSVNGDLGAGILEVVSAHDVSTAYDGLTVLVASGTITGALTIYGLSQ